MKKIYKHLETKLIHAAEPEPPINGAVSPVEGSQDHLGPVIVAQL